jgi:hypothetical protein
LSKSGQTENLFADHMCTNISITYHLIMSFYLPEQSALLFQLAIHWQDPDSPQNPCVLQSASVEQEKTERRKTIIISFDIHYRQKFGVICIITKLILLKTAVKAQNSL